MSKTLAKVFGIILLIAGLLGFFGNPVIGSMGYFHMNTALSVVHLVLGLVLLLASGTEAKAGRWLKITGIIVLLVAVYGFMKTPAGSTTMLLGLLDVNGATNWLHAILGIVFFLTGMSGGKQDMASGAQM